GSLLVLGVPGSGKTRVIEERFQWLVGRGHEPDRMVVVCASDAGAEAMRERLETALQRGDEKLLVHTPAQLAAELLRRADAVGRGDRLAMMVERIDELSVRHHDFGGSATALFGEFVRRIDRLKAELISCEEYARWAAALPDEDSGPAPLEREFAEVYRTH